MASGRVVARIAGDTATGSFTCLVRRAASGARVRYHIDVRNGAASPADVVIARDGETLHEMLVPATAHVIGIYELQGSDAPLVINFACDGTALVVHEAVGDADTETSENASPLVAASTALAVVGAASLTSVLWRRHRRQRAQAAAASVSIPRLADGASSAAGELMPALIDATPARDGFAGIHVGTPLDPEALEPGPPGVEIFDHLVRVSAGRRAPETWERRQRRRDPSFAPVVAGSIVAAALIAGYAVAHPHVGDLGAPNTVLAGSAIDVPYTTSGVGALRYSVVSSQGDTIAAGPLAARSGVLHIAIPSRGNDESYRITVNMAGPLGDASSVATVGSRALPAARIVTRTRAVPIVHSFAILPGVVDNAPVLNVYYDVSADTGTLRLIDSRGIAYQRAPLNPSGRTTLNLPAGVDPGTLAVELHAVRAGSAVDSRIALPSRTSLASPSPAPGTALSEAVPIVVPERVVGNVPIPVQILHHYPDLRVALLDATGRELAGRDVASGASTVDLPYPAVSQPTRVTVEATYRMRNEADTIVRPVLLVPSGG